MKFNYCPGMEWNVKEIEACDKEINQFAQDLNFIGLGEKLNQTIFSLTKLTDILRSNRIPIRGWMEPVEVLLIKLGLHASSINKLISAVPIFKMTNGNIISKQDISSIYILSRAQIECYLIIYYLILSPSNNDEGEFRHLLYQISGLSARQSYSVTLPQNIAKKEKEAREIEELRQKIDNNSFYQNLPLVERNKIDQNKPPAKLMGWEKLIKNCRITEKALLDNWRLYSNFAHSEYIGLLQVPSYFSDDNSQKQVLYSTLELAVLILSVTITEILNLFPDAIESYKTLIDKESRLYVTYWSIVGLKKGIQ